VPATKQSEFQQLTTDLEKVRQQLCGVTEQTGRSQGYAVIGESCAHIAHNMRTLLHNVRSLAQYEADARNADPNARTAFQYIIANASKLDVWARDIVHTVRPIELKLAAQSVDPVIIDSIAMLRPQLSERQIEVQYEPAEGVPNVQI